MIDLFREMRYPGSELVFEELLAQGEGYDRYIVSYLSEGNRVFALLTMPHSQIPATGWPVIIFNHGYIPPDKYKTTVLYEGYVDGFARNGYVVFRSDYRGHGRSSGEPLGGYTSPAYTVDVLNGLASIKTLPGVDPNRIGMWGHSMGGHITLRAMVVSQEIRAGVIWGGVVASYQDLFERWTRSSEPVPGPAPTRSPWLVVLESTYGTFQDNPEFWASISPSSYVSEISGPLQLHHGTADEDVPVEFSRNLHEKMLAANKHTELYLYVGDNHNLTGSLHVAIQRSVEFFDRYVKFGVR